MAGQLPGGRRQSSSRCHRARGQQGRFLSQQRDDSGGSAVGGDHVTGGVPSSLAARGRVPELNGPCSVGRGPNTSRSLLMWTERHRARVILKHLSDGSTMPRGPALTLLAVFALGAVMLGINIAASEPGAPPDTAAAAATGPAASTGAPPASGEAPTATTAATTAAPDPLPARARFVGEAQTANGTVPVSITVDGERAKVYVCDNRRIEAWLQGSARDGLVDARGRGANHLIGRHEGTQIAGTVQITGYPEWSFTAQATQDA